MESMRKRISPWILTLIAAPPILILGTVGNLWRIAGQRLESVEAEKAAELTQEKLPEAIPPLFADPLPDDASVHFADALRALGDPAELRKLGGELAYQPPPLQYPSPETLAAVWKRSRPAVEPLRKALRCSRVDRGAATGYENCLLLETSFLLSSEFAREEGRDVEALRLLVLMLGLEQVWTRFNVATFTANAAVEWSQVLDGHALTAADTEELCGFLDRLESSRPWLLDQVRRESLFRRIDALDFTQPDENGNAPSGPDPGWRQLWTRRLVAFEALGIIDSDLRELTRICALPLHEQYPAALALENSIPDDRLRIQSRSSHWKLPVEPVAFQGEIWLRMMLRMCRIATALAWYEVEKERKPATLDELVPRYLPRLEPCPVTGRPVRYEQGALISPGLEGVKEMTWMVRRR
jgi:hypothetical protein